MPDISMCKQYECPWSKSCYRFLAKSNEKQSYIKYEFDDSGCGYFIGIKPDFKNINSYQEIVEKIKNES